MEERVSETEKVRDMGSAAPYEEIVQMMRTSWDSWVSWVTETNKDTGYDGLLLVTSKADDGGSFENPGAERWGFSRSKKFEGSSSPPKIEMETRRGATF